MSRIDEAELRVDIAIAGGGLAGLSLADALCRIGYFGRIAVIEPRTSYADDRTWCFWDTLWHPYRRLVRQRWSSLSVADTDGRTVMRSLPYPYCRLSSRDFYDDVLTRLDVAPNVVLLRGREASVVTGNSVSLTDGGFVRANRVFDARPPSGPMTGPGRLLQQFVGWRVRLDEPLPDTATIGLMHFDLSQDDGITFAYTLPLSRWEILVEVTAFTPSLRLWETLTERVRDLVARRYPGEKLSSESGVIPMNPELHARMDEQGVVPIGTRAGAPRASSGYAFLPIQRHSQAIAACVAAGDAPDVPVRRWPIRALDRVFCQRLYASPAQAPSDFVRLFEKVSTDRLIRFLTETGGARDALSVMTALPTGSFVGAAVSAGKRVMTIEKAPDDVGVARRVAAKGR